MSRKAKAKSVVAIVNPVGPQTHVSRAKAQRYIDAKIAKFDTSGRLVLLRVDPAVVSRKLRAGPLSLVKVTEFSGPDALPESPVMPSWPTRSELVKRRHRGPVYPPLQSQVSSFPSTSKGE